MEKDLKPKYIYLGLFEITSGNAIIIDPYINNISILLDRIAPSELFSQRFTRVRSGAYRTYHEHINGRKFLLILHESYELENIINLHCEERGIVNTSFGEAVCICDEELLYSTSGCYYSSKILKEVYYSSEYLLTRLPDGQLTGDENNRLIRLAKEAENGYLSGAVINCVLGEDSNWSALDESNEFSTLWSYEIMNRLRSSLTGSVFLNGCVAASVMPILGNLQPVTAIYNNRKQVVGFRVPIN